MILEVHLIRFRCPSKGVMGNRCHTIMIYTSSIKPEATKPRLVFKNFQKPGLTSSFLGPGNGVVKWLEGGVATPATGLLVSFIRFWRLIRWNGAYRARNHCRTMTAQLSLITPFLAFSCLFHFASALWPMPRSLQTGTTLLKLSSNNFEIQVSDIPQAPQDLQDAVSRTMSRLHSDQLQRLIVGRGASDSAALAHAPSLARLTLALTPNSPPIKSIMEEATKEISKRSESYSLTIPDTDQGVATLTANSSLGLLRGLTTFEQFWYKVSGTVYSYQAPVQITNDSPAYVRVLIVCTLMIVYSYSCFVSRIVGSCWIRQGTCEFLLIINALF